jgi:hypothetical protein
MVYVEDDNYESRPPYNDRQHFVPSDDPDPPETRPALIEDARGCTVEPESLSRCGRILDAKRCYLSNECWWDVEFNECFHVPSVLQYLQYLVILLPVVYVVCYYGYAKPKLDAVWMPYPMFRGVYIGSVIFATVAFLYVGFRVIRSDAYDDKRSRYVHPINMLLAGAALTPITLALWADRDYSVYWTFIALLTTSIGAVWFALVHLRTSPKRRKDRVTVVALLYGLFHVIVMDNFVWWWLLFSSVEKT